MRWSAARAAAAALLILATAGCSAPAPQPTPSETETAAPTAATPPEVASPSPEPTPVATIDELVLRPTTLELRRGGSVVQVLDYMSPAADAVSALTAGFGYPPVDEPYEGSNHTPPGVYHAWGPVVVDERFYDEDRRSSEDIFSLVWPRFAVYFDGPAAGGVTLRTLGGHQQGEEWSAVTGDPEAEIWACDGTPIEVDDTYTSRGQERVTVIARADESEGSVLWLGAPAMEAQGCA
jgi:hypothetical protein